MTIAEIYHIISAQKPQVIYLSGKTSTGKSTFGRKLRDSLHYQVVELEAVLLDVIKLHGFDERATFRKVFRDSEDSEEKRLYLEATNRLITNAIQSRHPLVIEGAVANAETLERILSPARHMLFIYFHPEDIERYIQNLTNRFMQSGRDSYGGLPPTFWKYIEPDEFERFCKTRELTANLRSSIEQFATAAQAESLVRLQQYQQRFNDIEVVKV